jgi:hypothetical protein
MGETLVLENGTADMSDLAFHSLKDKDVFSIVERGVPG